MTRRSPGQQAADGPSCARASGCRNALSVMSGTGRPTCPLSGHAGRVGADTVRISELTFGISRGCADRVPGASSRCIGTFTVRLPELHAATFLADRTEASPGHARGRHPGPKRSAGSGHPRASTTLGAVHIAPSVATSAATDGPPGVREGRWSAKAELVFGGEPPRTGTENRLIKRKRPLSISSQFDSCSAACSFRGESAGSDIWAYRESGTRPRIQASPRDADAPSADRLISTGGGTSARTAGIAVPAP